MIWGYHHFRKHPYNHQTTGDPIPVQQSNRIRRWLSSKTLSLKKRWPWGIGWKKCRTASSNHCAFSAVCATRDGNPTSSIANTVYMFILLCFNFYNLYRLGKQFCRCNYTVVTVNGTTPKRWLLVRGHDKAIQGSCAIYFPNGISLYIHKWGFPKTVVPNNHGVFLINMIILGCFGGTTI